MPYELALTKCAQYDDALVAESLTRVLAPLGGLARFIAPGQRVLLKLNLLSAAAPERAVTTHPALVKAMIRQVQALGATPILGDSPGGVNTRTSFAALLQTTGIMPVIEETGCEWVNFDDSFSEIATKRARVFTQLMMVDIPREVDAVIALPKLKTHQFTYLTGAVKLLYGYLPGLKKVEYHLHMGADAARFAELLLDIYETLPPTLFVMDAVVGMEGKGPSSGTPRQVGLLLAGQSGPALDFLAAHLIGLAPLEVPTIAVAAQRGIGPRALEEITVHGEDPGAVRIPDFQPADTLRARGIPPWIATLSSWLFAPRPVIDPVACRKCGICVKSCPPHTITMTAGAVPVIHPHACIRCFCCHELCPAQAIDVAGPRFSMPGLRKKRG